MRTLFAAAGAAALLGCTPTQSDLADREALVEARPIGPPISCVELSNIRDTRVRDDSTIDFNLRDGRTLRNRLPYSCPSLGFEEAFSYKTSLSRLCSVDTITVLSRAGGTFNGATCGLGQFQPVELPRRRRS